MRKASAEAADAFPLLIQLIVKPLHPFRRFLPHGLGHVAVDIQGELSCRMAQVCLDGLDIIACIEGGDGEGVSEVVEAGFLHTGTLNSLALAKLGNGERAALKRSVGVMLSEADAKALAAFYRCHPPVKDEDCWFVAACLYCFWDAKTDYEESIEKVFAQLLEKKKISKAGQLWSFDLIAAPTKKVGAEGKKNSQRRILRTPGERQEWLERQAEQNGFAILQAQELEQLHICGRHKADKGGVMYHDAYHYQGILQITDGEAFRRAMQTGIGSGKAYGFGMMMVKRL